MRSARRHGSTMLILIDHLARRKRIRQAVPPRLEELAAEYDKLSEPLRVALNAFLEAPPDSWARSLFEVGEHLAGFDLSDATWGYPSPPAWNASDGVLGNYGLLQLARAAAARDRPAFDDLCLSLGAEPGVAAQMIADRLSFALRLLTRSRRDARERTLPRVREFLCGEWVELSDNTRWELARLGCGLSPVVEDALGHWADPFNTPVWPAGGRLAPLGFRGDHFGGLASQDGHADVPSVSKEAGESEPSAKAAPKKNIEAAPKKKSTERGDGTAKLIAALTLHHEYANGGCLKCDYAGNNELARAAEVAASTASKFFRDHFGGYTKYRVLCQSRAGLASKLTDLNNDRPPHATYGRRPPGEDDRRDE